MFDIINMFVYKCTYKTFSTLFKIHNCLLIYVRIKFSFIIYFIKRFIYLNINYLDII